MKAQDVRLGNLLLNPYSNEPEEVCSIRPVQALNTKYEINEEHPDFFKGIPLTSEWLERFGFWKISDWRFQSNDWMIERWLSTSVWHFRLRATEKESYEVTKLEYVHTLQNIWFAVEGQELTLKEGKEIDGMDKGVEKKKAETDGERKV